VLHQLSSGEAIFRQPLQTLPHEVDGNLAHFLVLHRFEQALEAHAGDGMGGVNVLALFVPVNSGACALFEKRLWRWTKKGMVLGECVCFGPRLVNSVWHDRDFPGEHLQGHASDHPDVDGGVEGSSKKNFRCSEGLRAAHAWCGIAHVVFRDPHRFAEVVELWETEAVFGDDEGFGFGDRVLIAIFAVVDLASLWVLLQLVYVLFEEVAGEAEQNVVELYVCVNEEALSVQEVESLEGVHQNFFSEREWKVA